MLWGCRKISHELKKAGIEWHHITVNKIIQTFRKNGLIKPIGSWKQFLKTHWDSLYGVDFMTIDTLFGKRFYLLIILKLKSGEALKPHITPVDVYFYVLEGTGIVLVGDEKNEVSEGTLIDSPKGIVHCWFNESDKPLRILVNKVPKPADSTKLL